MAPDASLVLALHQSQEEQCMLFWKLATSYVRDFPPWVVAQIDEAIDGDTATTTNFAMVVTLMARLGAARGLRCVPLVMADAVTVTQALVLEKALLTLRTDSLIVGAHVDDAQTGCANPLGTALQQWLDAMLRAPGAPPPATR